MEKRLTGTQVTVVSGEVLEYGYDEDMGGVELKIAGTNGLSVVWLSPGDAPTGYQVKEGDFVALKYTRNRRQAGGRWCFHSLEVSERAVRNHDQEDALLEALTTTRDLLKAVFKDDRFTDTLAGENYLDLEAISYNLNRIILNSCAKRSSTDDDTKET